MTIPNPTDAPTLLTDADVLRRVELLVGPAAEVRQLWIMFVDGDGRQAPVVLPLSGLPQSPQAGRIDGLRQILAGLRDDLATDLGPGSVILTLERIGRDEVLPADETWASALRTTCERAGVALRGLFLSTDGGVRSLDV